ncbi:VCBS domain-containing protein [Litorilituus sediminis]|uniref:Tandem-95 repeat protein n=1 Tax=Litorilituus sediminis TaxID=718192 RepID=A0A4P6P9T2_9GAMM|nr:VCBS domain-containing protein [Litorilituus sediminis]QBG37049.1 tandem-95 repeat protein [Litorilituus sediminis]
MQEVKLVEVGVVVSVVGNVSIITAEGIKRTLKVGDKVNPGDIILTSQQAKAVVQFEEHNGPVTVDSSCAACIAMDTNDSATVHVQEVAGDVLVLEEANVEQLQNLILAGVDPTATDNDDIENLQALIEQGIDPTSAETFEAAAAGESGRQGSSISPKVDATIEEVAVTAGYDTSYAATTATNIAASSDDNEPRPAIISGEDQGIVVEDSATSISGKLDIIDTNADETQFIAETITSQYGDLVIDEQGQWQFELANDLAEIQALGEQDTLTQTITVTSVDGTEHTITIEIQGTDDLSQITLAEGDSDVGSVTEDANVNGQNQLTTSGHLTVTDVDTSDVAAFDPNSVSSTNTLGTLTIDADGNWQYNIDNSLSQVQSLDDGESFTETFTVQTIDGQTHEITVTVNGVDDVSVISLEAGDSDLGSVTEDANVNGQNQLTTSGHLTVTDVDASDVAAFDPNSVSSTNTLGTLTIDADGNWQYNIDNSLSQVQSLDDGESFTEIFTVQTIDGQTHEITVTVNGVDDVSVISLEAGDSDIGSVTEDANVNGENQLTTSGHLTVTDVDASDVAAFDPNSVSSNNTLGTLTIDADGNWQYNIDNSLSQVQSLDDGESFTETFTVQTIDGQTHEITVTVNGVDDVSVISLEAGDSDVGSVTEDANVNGQNQLTTSGHLTVTDVDASDVAAFEPNSVSSTNTLGTLTIDADGNWQYDIDNSLSQVQSLDEGESFTETFTVQTIDGQTHEITVTVNGVDDVSVISLEAGDSDLGSVTEDANVNGQNQLTTSGHLTVTDVDASDVAAFDPNSVVSNNTLGTLTIDADGNWQYNIDNSLSQVQDLAAGESFTETFTVQTIDGQSHTIVVTVNGANDGPIAVDDSLAINEDASATVIDVLANDTDLDGDTLTVTGVTQPANGTVTLVNGVVTFIPDANFSGQTSFTYTISDGNGGTDTATVTVNVNPQNDDPVAVDDIVSINEADGATVIDVLGNDTDLDGDTLTVTGVTQPANGTVTLVNGVVTYIPEANFDGQVTFTYTISDGNGGTDTATVTLTVNGENNDPVAVDDIVSINEADGATVIDVLGNDTDLDGDTLTVTGVTQPANGTVTLVNGVVTYIPEANFDGQVTFTYTISDGNGGTDTATVTLTVNGQNNDPVAVDDIVSINEADGATVIDVLGNDTDLDGDTLTVTGVTQPANGTVTLVNGVVTYIPEANFDGQVTFTYTISDGNGGTDTATVTLNVNAAGDVTPPTVADQSFSYQENQVADAVVGTLAANGDVATYTFSNGSQTSQDGYYQIDNNGVITITAAGVLAEVNDFEQGANTGDYTVIAADAAGNETTITVTLSETNVDDTAPTVADQSFSYQENQVADAVVGTLANNNDVATYTFSNGSTTSADGYYQIDNNGVITITAAGVLAEVNDFEQGANTGDYTVIAADAAGNETTITVTLSETNVDDTAPTVADQSFSYEENQVADAVVGTLAANGDVATYTFSNGSTTSADGYYQIDNNGVITITAAGVLAEVNDFEQGANTGDYTVIAADAAGNETTITVTLIETNVDDTAPTVADQSFSYQENQVADAVVGTLAANGDVATYTFSNGSTTSADGYYQIDNNGVITITAAGVLAEVNDFEQGANTGDYTVIAADAAGNETTITVTLSETNVDDTAPSVADQSFSYQENQVADAVVGTLANNNDVATYTFSNGSTTSADGYYQIDNNGVITITAAGVLAEVNDFEQGANTGDYTVIAADAAGNETTITVTLSETNVDDTAPSVADQSFSYQENQVVDAVVGTLANNNDVATYTFSNGSTTSADGYYQIDNNGVITITAAGVLAEVNDFEQGANTGDYTVIAADAAGNEATITVTLSETNVDDTAPSVADQSFSYQENQVADAVVGTLAANGDVATYTFSNGSTTSADGYYQIDNNGVITITAAGVLAEVNDFEQGANTGDYTVIAADAAGNETNITVTLSETNVDDTAPTVADQSFSYQENQVADAVVGTLAANDDVETYTFSNGSTTSADGYYQIDNNGVITITAAGVLAEVNDFEQGANTGDYTVIAADAAGNETTITVTLSETNVDDTAPTVADQSFSYQENQVADAVVGTLTNNPDVASYTFSNGSTTSADGYYQIDNNGVITITAAGVLAEVNDFEQGANTGDYTVIAADAAGNETTITVTLSETNVDDTAPTVADQSFSYEENQVADAVVGMLAANGDVATYTFSNGSTTSADGYYQIDNNGVITITAAGVLAEVNDFEQGANTGDYTVIAADAAGNETTITVTLSETNVDDTAPTVADQSFSYEENQVADAVVGTLTNNPDVASYTFSNGSTTSADGYYQIDNNGVITITAAGVLAEVNDFEQGANTGDYTVIAADAAGNETTITVTLSETNVDDTAPTVADQSFSYEENQVADAVVGMLAANGDVATYTFSNGSTTSADGYYQIDNNGVITITAAGVLAEVNDFEQGSNTGDYTVIAADAAGNETTITVTLSETNVDDTAPTVADQSFSYQENQVADAVVGMLTNNPDVASYTFSNGSTTSADGYYQIDNNGVITITAAGVLAEVNDFEQGANTGDYTVIAADAAGNETTITVTLSETNVDDTAPTVVDQSFSYQENQVADAVVGTLAANGDVATYTFSNGSQTSQDGYYQIDNNGVITITAAGVLAEVNDFEQGANTGDYTVIAADAAGNETTITVTLSETNLDDTAPSVADQSFSYQENQVADAVVGTLAANGDVATYTFSNGSTTSADGYYQIDNNGVITITAAGVLAEVNDFEQGANTGDYTVIAADAAGNETTITVTLSETNVDDTAPTVADQSFSYQENQVADAVVGTLTNNPDVASYTFSNGSTTSADGYYQIDNNGVITITAAGVLAEVNDFEQGANTGDYTVIAADAAGNETTITVTLSETNLDDTAPTVADQSFSYEENQVADAVVATLALNIDVASYTFSNGTQLSDDGFYAINDDGQISITALGVAAHVNDFEQGANSGIYTVVAADSVGNSTSFTVTLSETDLNDYSPIASNDGEGSGVIVWGDNLLVNGDAETEGGNGWQVTGGSLYEEGYGSYIEGNSSTDNGSYFYGSGSHVVSSQTVNLGLAEEFTLSGDLGTSGSDEAELKVVFRDINGDIVGEFSTGKITQLGVMKWYEISNSIPAGAVTATIEMHMYDSNSDSDSYADAFFDNVSFVTGEAGHELVVDEDSQITVDVLANDYDPDGDPIAVTHIEGQAVSNGDSVEIKQNGVVVGIATLVAGQIVFTPSAALQAMNDGESTEVIFDYTITDQPNAGAAQSDTATVKILVTGSNEAPSLSLLTDGTVNEQGLVDGDANSGSEYTSGSFFVSGGGITSLEIAGQTITSADLAAGNVSVNTGEGVITITSFDANTGEVSYSYKLSAAQAHNSGDIINDTITVKATNSQGSVDGSFNIAIVDDAPSVSGDMQSIQFGEQITNLIIVLDTSGSMDYDMSSSDDTSRMEVAIDAIKQLLDAYDELGSVNVQLVGFEYSTTTSGQGVWLNLADAKQWLDTYTTPDGGTDYAAGLQAAIDNYSAPNNNGATYAYFISDGEPTYQQKALNFEDDWERFLAENNINESFAIGIGNVPTQYLDIAAHANGVDTATTLVHSASDMANYLLNTVAVEKTGNLLVDLIAGNSNIGADTQGATLSITIDGNTYTLADATNGMLVINTNKGGELTINFDDSTYSYSAKTNSNGRQDYVEEFIVGITDGDGDSATSTFSVNVGFPSHTQSTDLTDVLYGSAASETISGAGGNDVLYGFAGDDILKGGSGDDLLIGGAGSDSLRGNGGSDTYYFGSDAADGSIDTITKFSNGDSIDLSDLLNGETDGADSLAEYLHFSFDGTNTLISVDKDKNGTTDLTIKLNDVNLVDGAVDDAAIIQKLLDEAKLNVD